jgi:hypothetical protein
LLYGFELFYKRLLFLAIVWCQLLVLRHDIDMAVVLGKKKNFSVQIDDSCMSEEAKITGGDKTLDMSECLTWRQERLGTMYRNMLNRFIGGHERKDPV